MKAKIIGTGSYLPERVLSNRDLEKMVDTTDEWIVSRTGMKERRIAAEDEFTSSMGAKAATAALENAQIETKDVDFILVATSTPDYLFPSTAALIQDLIGLKEVPALDIQAACTGFIYALSLAKGYIESGVYRHVLVIASEKLSSVVDYEDRRTCVLFGDGAAAAVVSSEGAGFELDGVTLGADGSLAELLTLKGGGARHPASEHTLKRGDHYIAMEGKEVFKHAVRRMQAAAQECLDQVGIDEKEIDWVVPHQANDRIIMAMAKRFQLPEEKVVKTVHKYGNTSASSVAIALDELICGTKMKLGERVLLVAFGAGFTWGASLLTKVDQ